MNCLKNGIALMVLLTCCGVAAGDEVSYSHLELRHNDTFLDVEEGSRYQLDSLGIAASWQVADHLALLADGKRTRVDGTEFNSFRAGATMFVSLFGVADLYATAAHNFGSGVADLGIGLRARPAQVVEFNVYLGSSTVERSKTGSTAGLAVEFGLRCYLTRALAAGFDHQNFGPDDTGHINRLSIRYDFGRD